MLVFFFLALTIAIGACHRKDLCNWQQISAKSRNDSFSAVIPVELRCMKGFLEWKVPNGGLQVKFKAPVELLGAEFTVRLISKKSKAIFYEETANNGLKILKSSEQHDPKSAISITSSNGDAGLYIAVHSEEDEAAKASELRIDYELEKSQEFSAMSECRMCSVEKMAELFCKGGFAVKAKVQNKYIHNDGMNVYLDLHVYHVFHQSLQLFLKSYEGGYYIGCVKMLGKCSPPKGRHHYLFLGEIDPQSTSANVECYLKFGLWKRIKDQIKCHKSKRKVVKHSPLNIKDVFYATAQETVSSRDLK